MTIALAALTALLGMPLVLAVLLSVSRVRRSRPWSRRPARLQAPPTVLPQDGSRWSSGQLPNRGDTQNDVGRCRAAPDRLRAVVPWPDRHVAAARRALVLEVRGAAGSVAAGLEEGRSVDGLQRVMARLTEQAQALERDLALISANPDRQTRQRLLDHEQPRLQMVQRACLDVRRAVLLSGSLAAVPLLRRMENDLNDQVIALALRARTHTQLSDP